MEASVRLRTALSKPDNRMKPKTGVFFGEKQ